MIPRTCTKKTNSDIHETPLKNSLLAFQCWHAEYKKSIIKISHFSFKDCGGYSGVVQSTPKFYKEAKLCLAYTYDEGEENQGRIDR